MRVGAAPQDGLRPQADRDERRGSANKAVLDSIFIQGIQNDSDDPLAMCRSEPFTCKTDAGIEHADRFEDPLVGICEVIRLNGDDRKKFDVVIKNSHVA